MQAGKEGNFREHGHKSVCIHTHTHTHSHVIYYKRVHNNGEELCTLYGGGTKFCMGRYEDKGMKKSNRSRSSILLLRLFSMWC